MLSNGGEGACAPKSHYDDLQNYWKGVNQKTNGSFDPWLLWPAIGATKYIGSASNILNILC